MMSSLREDVTVLDSIEFHIERPRFDREIRLESYPELTDEVDRFLNYAVPMVHPKAAYRVAYVERRDGSQVDLGDQSFESEVLAENLAEVHRVFAYVATCGADLGALHLSGFDPFASFWHATLKSMALASASRALREHIQATYDIEEYSSMNPGSGNVDVWPIEQQRQLFALFGDTENLIGVRLTDSFLMVPDKTVSGIFFPSDVSYVNCHTCEREVCASRSAPFRGQR